MHQTGMKTYLIKDYGAGMQEMGNTGFNIHLY